MRRNLLVLIIILLSSAWIPLAYAPIIPHEYTLDIPCFAPAKITFNYAYTHNHSISDISTFGSSLYTHEGGPNFYEFRAMDVDDYHFTLTIQYSRPQNQTILVGLWSGSLPMQGYDMESLFEEVTIHVRLRVQAEPTYPTEEEVANQVVYQVQRNLQDYYEAMNTLILQQNQAIATASMLSFATAAISLIMVVVVLYELRQFRQRGPR